MPAASSKLNEHIVKIAIYVAVSAHFINSFLASDTFVSLNFNAVLSLLAAYTALCELLYMTKRINLPPGKLGIPIIGFFPDLLLKHKFDLDAFYLGLRERWGSVFMMSMLMIGPTVVLSDLPSLTWLFQNDRKSFTENNWPSHISKLLGPNGVSTAKGTRHRFLRRLMEPFFAPTFIQNYFRTMIEVTDQELARWHKMGTWVPSAVFKLYTIRLFFYTAFAEIEEEVLLQLHNDFTDWLAGFASLTGSIRVPHTNFDKGMKARERLVQTFDKLIDKFLAENPRDSERAKTTLVGRILYGDDNDNGEKGRQMTREDQIDNLLVLVFAGHDTTYASISTLLHFISQHPDVEKALIEEVSKLKEPLDAEELKNAPVLNAVAMESWRCSPPVGGGFRKATKELEYEGYTFPKGTTFMYNIILASRDKSVYKNPNEFHIERFLPKDHPMAKPEWIPTSQAAYRIFGGGPTVCLGQNFAKMEIRVILARMFRQYNVSIKNSKKIPIPVNLFSVDFQLEKKA